MKKSIVLIYLSILCTHGFSKDKPGYIITNSHDTIYGLIKDQNETQYSQQCIFTPNDSKMEQKYLPGNIYAFRITEGKFYISQSILVGGKPKEVFLEWLIRGRANILAYNNSAIDVRYFM